MEQKNGSIMMGIAAAAAAFIVMFLIVLFMKYKMMPSDERFQRNCMQGVATEVIKAGAAKEGSLTKGGPAHVKLYATFPWINPKKPPKNELMVNTRTFCNAVFDKETKNNMLYNETNATAEGTHSLNAARMTLDRLDNGWGNGNMIKEERAALLKAINDWGVHGHDADAQAAIEKYSRQVSNSPAVANINRIIAQGQGRFKKDDICRHSKAFAEAGIAADPDAFFKKIGCK